MATKISEFTSDSITLSDNITFIRNGANYKTTVTDLTTAIGTVGSITAVGAPAATPVLNQPSAGDNQIRGIESGSGVIASVSAQDGINLSWNVEQNSIGFPITSGLSNAKPVLSSLIAGTGVSIAQGVDTLTISATGATTATNTVIINQESDFPVQDATTITLSEKTRFVIGSDVSTAKRFICEDGFLLTAENIFGAVLTYTGTGAMFTGVGVGGTCELISLDAPNSSQCFDMTDSSLTKVFVCRSVRVLNAPKWGTYTGFLITVINSSSGNNCDDGLTISGTGLFILSINEFFVTSSSATCKQIDLGVSIISNIEINNMILVAPSGAIQLNGAASNANVPAGLFGQMSNSTVAGGATAQLAGIDVTDYRWEFASNNLLSDSISDALMGFNNNATETVIATINTPVVVNAVWTLEDSSHFTMTTAGRATFLKDKSEHLPVDIALGIVSASGGSIDATVYLAINGSVVANTGRTVAISGSTPRTLSIPWQASFSNGDYAEVYVENNTGTGNIIVENCILRIN